MFEKDGPPDEGGGGEDTPPAADNTTSTPETAKPQDVDGDPSQPEAPRQPDDEILPLTSERPPVTSDLTELLDQPGVDPLWRHYGEALIYDRALTGRWFTVDDLRADGLGEPAHPNHWGALFGAMARAGVIRAVGAGRSPRPSRASGWRAIWVGTEAVRRGVAA